ncbi:MAG TPA: T9SS type B sorting domain-containing protein, partial [Flavobacterium sp.]|uniref:T9SS type B sorting domain-containing protein n=1 Tax=Flavobacterium sp. TaxID=239 RepID=UPI002CA0E8E1
VYMLVADVGTCMVRGYMNVEYAPEPNDTVLIQCDDNNDGIATFNLENAIPTITGGDTQMDITGYYHNLTDAQNEQSEITNPQTYSNAFGNSIVVRTENLQFGCIDYAVITLQVVNNAITPINPVKECDSVLPQDGLYPFNLDTISQQILTSNALPSTYEIHYFLSSQDAFLLNNPLNTPFTNTTAYQQIIYARITNGPDCFGILPVTLIVSSFPDLEDETVAICDGESTVLDAGSGYTSYSWDTTPVQTTQTITVSEAGSYTVTVTNSDDCEATKTFTVTVSEIATILNIEVNSFSGMNNSITIYVSGNGNYEYSIDGVNYQDSNIFMNVLPGEYQVFVRDKNGCGNPPPQTVYVLDYPRFFTPNGDGYNDTWFIKNLDAFYPNSKLYVFDRYGKLVKHISPLNDGWNGTLNNYSLPSDDYWFTLSLDNGRIIKGHFSLKR